MANDVGDLHVELKGVDLNCHWCLSRLLNGVGAKKAQATPGSCFGGDASNQVQSLGPQFRMEDPVINTDSERGHSGAREHLRLQAAVHGNGGGGTVRFGGLFASAKPRELGNFIDLPGPKYPIRGPKAYGVNGQKLRDGGRPLECASGAHVPMWTQAWDTEVCDSRSLAMRAP